MNDLIILEKEMTEIEQLKRNLNAEFEMKNMRELWYFLDIKVIKDHEEYQLIIDQNIYICMILERFDMKDYNFASTSIITGIKLQQTSIENVLIDQQNYQNMIKSIMYVILYTRLNLAYAISQLSQFNAKLTFIHEAATKWVLRYLKATVDLEITFEKDLTLKNYNDADWKANENRKSIFEYIYMLKSEAISWSSKRQFIVTLSTTEAEYIAFIQAAKKSI